MGSQFPHQADADKALDMINEVLSLLAVPPEGVRPRELSTDAALWLSDLAYEWALKVDRGETTLSYALRTVAVLSYERAAEGAQGWRAYVQHKDGCDAWPRFDSHFTGASHVGKCTCGLAELLADPPAREET